MQLRPLGLGLLLLSGFAGADILPTPCPSWPWAVMVYGGILEKTSIYNALTLRSKKGPAIFSLEVSRELAPDNVIRRFFQPIVSTMALTANVSYINDPAGAIYEFNPYMQFRWENFPWDKYVVNTYAIGWGVSYDSRVSTWEKQDSDNSKRLLNYLMFETTLAAPEYPRLQLVLRLHHRSGAFGLYGADNTSSNFVGAGVRYLF